MRLQSKERHPEKDRTSKTIKPRRVLEEKRRPFEMLTIKPPQSNVGSLRQMVAEQSLNNSELQPWGQEKLTIDRPGDKCEQEANQVAEQIMRAPKPTFQTKSPLNLFETQFGADFREVKIFTDEKAAHMASEIGARAFTVGNSIFFGHGHYAPETTSGKKLLAHELVHVCQQGEGPIRVQRDTAPPLVAQSVTRWGERAGGPGGYSERRGLDPDVPWTAFRRTIPDPTVLIDVARSYDIEPADLLAMLHLEGGLRRPTRIQRGLDPASYVALHLWGSFGMDDFAVVHRAGPGEEDNQFNFQARHRGRILYQLGQMHEFGLLPNASGRLPPDSANQLTPNQLLTRLIAEINPSTGQRSAGFTRWALTIVAMTIAKRRHLASRSLDELRALGYDTTDHEIRRFSYGGLLRASETEREATMRVGWNVLPTSVARLSMGRPRGFLAALQVIERSFTEWNSTELRIAREDIFSWAARGLEGSPIEIMRSSVASIPGLPADVRRDIENALSGADIYPVIDAVIAILIRSMGIRNIRDYIDTMVRDYPSFLERYPALLRFINPSIPQRGLGDYNRVLTRFQAMRQISRAELFVATHSRGP